ncbi:YozQ family protein [Fictibacillus nanhaiensis]|uniref:YozQ family protein n=1 Tax=Fictibacillus nanhaiensis TaxID=742169 RepID=UPI0020415466|nr:YozQ family protein [Fictibacillus nanhaiensis]MCM3731953.1 YozQ family protein [Fictibacillus nanhaiensis]
MADKNKQSEKIAEKNYEPNKKNKSDIDKSLETVHEQINDTFNQGTIDEKEKQEKKKDEKSNS